MNLHLPPSCRCHCYTCWAHRLVSEDMVVLLCLMLDRLSVLQSHMVVCRGSSGGGAGLLSKAHHTAHTFAATQRLCLHCQSEGPAGELTLDAVLLAAFTCSMLAAATLLRLLLACAATRCQVCADQLQPHQAALSQMYCAVPGRRCATAT